MDEIELVSSTKTNDHDKEDDIVEEKDEEEGGSG